MWVDVSQSVRDPPCLYVLSKQVHFFIHLFCFSLKVGALVLVLKCTKLGECNDSQLFHSRFKFKNSQCLPFNLSVIT
jgi:hypothetical protein